MGNEHKSPALFTLSELVLFSNKEKIITDQYCKCQKNDTKIKFQKKICTRISNLLKKENATSSISFTNNKLLLLGGTGKRKRKTIDYAKLNNDGFDDSFVLSNQDKHCFKRANRKINKQSDVKFKSTNRINKLEKNNDTKLNTSISQEVKFLKNKY